MRVRLVHVTRFDYSADVVEGVMEVRLGPFSDSTQRWDRFHLGVTPTGSVRQYVDGFGNRTHLVTVGKPHRTLEVVTRSELSTTLENPIAPPSKPPRPLLPSDEIDFRSPSPLVPALPEFAEVLAEPGVADDPTSFEGVRALSRLVHDGFTYEHWTSPRDAKTGIGLCRAAGVPARYVSGYTVSEPTSENEPRREQASHAWVEAYTPTHGWRGFDATNDVVVGDAHVKVAVGRDYADVSPTRGSFRGHAEQQLGVRVEAYRID